MSTSALHALSRFLLAGLLLAALLLAFGSGVQPSAAAVPSSAPTPAPSPAQAGAATGGVTGRVVGASGAPVGGVTVTLLDLRNRRRSTTLTTGADGRFAFAGSQRPEVFAVRVCEPGSPCRSPSEVTRVAKKYVGPSGSAYSVLALHRYFETTDGAPSLALGTIRTARPGTLVARVDNGSTAGHVTASGLRAPVRRGVATVRGLAPGRHVVTNHGQRRVVTVLSGRVARVSFAVPLATVRGRVVVGGRPRPGVPVSLEGSTTSRVKTTLTDREGRYSFRALLGGTGLTYRLRVGMAGLDLRLGFPKAYQRFTLSPGQVRRVDVDAPSGSRGSLDVTIDGGGTPRRPASVSLLSPTGSWIGAAYVTEGSVRIDGLRPGAYRVYAQWTNGAKQRALNAWSTVTVRRGAATPALLVGRSGPGSITVRSAPGDEIVVFSLATVVDPTDPRAGSLRLQRRRDLIGTDTALFPSLPDGSYVVVGRSGQPSASPEPQQVTVAGGEVVVDLTSGPHRGSLRGRVVDPATGRPWPWTGQLITGMTCSGVLGSGTAQVLGPEVEPVLSIVGLPAGDYRCVLSGVHSDRGAPYAVSGSQTLAVRGTVHVDAGQENSASFPVPLS